MVRRIKSSATYGLQFLMSTIDFAQDIEDDMRNLRTTATSVLNKYTPTSLSHYEPRAKTSERKSR